MVEEYWQKTPFYPAPFSCHAGGNAYEWPGKPKSSNAQPSCSWNLLLAQVKAQLCGTVVVGIVGMHCWGTAGAREGCRRGRWWVLWDGAGWVPPCGTQSCFALGTCVFSSCFPVCSPMELEPELGEKARTQGKAGRLNIYLWSALWFFFSILMLLFGVVLEQVEDRSGVCGQVRPSSSLLFTSHLPELWASGRQWWETANQKWCPDIPLVAIADSWSSSHSFFCCCFFLH